MTTLTPTALTNAVSKDAREITLDSVSTPSVVADSVLFFNGEGCEAIDTPVGNVVRVRRGCFGTRQKAHAAGHRVFAGPRSLFMQGMPLLGEPGVQSAQVALPRIVMPGEHFGSGDGKVFVLGGQNGTEWMEIPLAGPDRLKPRHIRARFTIAQVNAGAQLLAAIQGFGYRMTGATAISVGGAAAGLTTLDIDAVLTSSRKLVAFAQASLTQSTVLRDGNSGAAVLADGASYTLNDVNTSIDVTVTGSDIITATHIDIAFEYVVE